MKITKIKILKNKVNIYIDDEKLELDKDVYPNFYLYEGKELSKKEYQSIKEYNQIASLMKYALALRSKAIYSEYKMREKLYNKGGDKKAVDTIIKSMKEYDLIDDNAFILEHIEYYNSLNYGKNKIISKLSSKGIFEERLNKISFPVSTEKKKAKAIFKRLEKKYSKYNFAQKKQHIYNAYISSGFDSDIAKFVVDSMLEEKDEKEELKKLKDAYLKTKMRLSKKYAKKELKQKVIQSLLQKGYRMNDIIKIIEKDNL